MKIGSAVVVANTQRPALHEEHPSMSQSTTDTAVFVEDGARVGTPAILSSPNISEPTNAVNDTIPTPSVYADARGEIHNVLVGAPGRATDGKRINILHTRRGVMRSGDIHPNFQCDFVFSGSVEVWTLSKDGTTLKRRYGSKEYIEIPPYVPHVFNFLDDTVMAEWWEGRGDETSSDFRAYFYVPYRRIVDESFDKDAAAAMKGEMKLFTEVTGSVDKNMGRGDSGVALTWLLGGVALGLVSFSFGIKMGRGNK